LVNFGNTPPLLGLPGQPIQSLDAALLLLLNVFMEYFQREDFVFFPCHLEGLWLVSCMFAIVRFNLEQALCWVTVPMRIRKVGIIHIYWMESPIVGKHQIVNIFLLMHQHLQSILEGPQVGHKVIVLNPSIFESKEDDFPWWHIQVDSMSKDILRAWQSSTVDGGDFFFAMVGVLQ
jgi:hypothetical protein